MKFVNNKAKEAALWVMAGLMSLGLCGCDGNMVREGNDDASIDSLRMELREANAKLDAMTERVEECCDCGCDKEDKKPAPKPRPRKPVVRPCVPETVIVVKHDTVYQPVQPKQDSAMIKIVGMRCGTQVVRGR